MDALWIAAAQYFLGAAVTGLTVYVARLSRLMGVFKDFPPHRHDNGHIIYPKGYEPTPVQNINSRGASAGMD